MKTAKTKVVKAIKAWIEVYPNGTFPTIWFSKPPKGNYNMAREYGCDIYPCTISFIIPKKTK